MKSRKWSLIKNNVVYLRPKYFSIMENIIIDTDFEVVKKDVRPTITNYYIFYKKQEFVKEDICNFALSFREQQKDVKCNIHIIDSKDIEPFMDNFSWLPKEEQTKKANHFVATLSFDTNSIIWYPFRE